MLNENLSHPTIDRRGAAYQDTEAGILKEAQRVFTQTEGSEYISEWYKNALLSTEIQTPELLKDDYEHLHEQLIPKTFNRANRVQLLEVVSGLHTILKAETGDLLAMVKQVPISQMFMSSDPNNAQYTFPSSDSIPYNDPGLVLSKKEFRAIAAQVSKVAENFNDTDFSREIKNQLKLIASIAHLGGDWRSGITNLDNVSDKEKINLINLYLSNKIGAIFQYIESRLEDNGIDNKDRVAVANTLLKYGLITNKNNDGALEEIVKTTIFTNSFHESFSNWANRIYDNESDVRLRNPFLLEVVNKIVIASKRIFSFRIDLITNPEYNTNLWEPFQSFLNSKGEVLNLEEKNRLETASYINKLAITLIDESPNQYMTKKVLVYLEQLLINEFSEFLIEFSNNANEVETQEAQAAKEVAEA